VDDLLELRRRIDRHGLCDSKAEEV
jgi:hypothetical protein